MNDIKGTKDFISRQISTGKIVYNGKPFEGYQVVYFSSNENVIESVNNVYQNGIDNALSVLASGDQIFEMINKGIYNIDTFDKNILTEYYVLGLKRAMIIKYSYQEYLNTLKILINKDPNKVLIDETIISLLPYMDEKYRKFWQEIINYEINIQKNNEVKHNIINIMFINLSNPDTYALRYGYLKDEDTYNNFKTKLLKANITFKNCNALDLDKNFNKKYDLVYLSNILDYFYYDLGFDWSTKQLNNFKSKLNRITQDDAKILLHYIFNYYFSSSVSTKLINYSNINDSDIKDCEIIKVKKHQLDTVGDGNIIYNRSR